MTLRGLHTTWTSLVKQVRSLLPEGGMLSKTEWRQRHTAILWLLRLHVVGLFIFSMLEGNGLVHSLFEAAALLPWVVLASTSRVSRRMRACAASLGLLSASAVLVHLFNGAIEAHFHFFVMIAVIAFYQDWLPFLLALVFVLFEHGLAGLLVPSSVYNHADAAAEPWKWATIHAVFVLAASAAHVAHWRLIELQQAQRANAQKVLRESQRTLATLMSNLPGMAYRCANDANWTTEFVSEGCLELSGHTPEDLMSHRISWTDLIHPDDRDRLWEETQVALASRQAFHHVYRITMAAGWERWVWEQGRGVYDERGELLALEGFVADVTERRHAEQALAHQAQHDPLTDLPNRVLLRHELQEALRHGRTADAPLALLMMDLDRFKEINDTFGHRYGDDLLQLVGERLQRRLGGAGMLARLGGDEFGVLLPTASMDVALQVARELLDAQDAPFNLEGQSIALGASVGIAMFPDHGSESETLLRHAEVAMYVAKESGFGVSIYSDADDKYSAERLTLAGELRQALDSQQLMLHYQPIFDCIEQRVTGVEALVRWNHPHRGLVPPDQFIPLAEQSGMIKPLTEQVLNMALRQCRAWRDEGLDLTMSVNLSMRNLHDPHLPELIADLLQAEGIPPSQLILEITESSIMADPTRALEVLARLRALGTRMSIDDFGTGYSSLAYLKRLPVDGLKIDRSFVSKLATDASDRAIVRTAVELAHNLGLRVVAEGVEDVASLSELNALGCDAAQGYYLGRPMPAADLSRLFDSRPWSGGSERAA